MDNSYKPHYNPSYGDFRIVLQSLQNSPRKPAPDLR